MRPTVASQGL